MFAEYTIPHTKTPMFAMQSTYDVPKAAPRHFVRDTIVQTSGNNLAESITASLLMTNSENGMFLDLCRHHRCAEWNEIRIDGDYVSTSRFRRGTINSEFGVKKGGKKLWIQAQPKVCAECCKMAWVSI